MRLDLLSGADDAGLVAAITRGHEPALNEVMRRHGPAVSGLARRLLGDGALAEDLTQEIFVGLWRQPERFDASRGKLRTLLLTQTHGRAVDMLRTISARKRREEKVGLEPTVDPPDVDSELMNLSQAEIIRAAIDRLPADERMAINLAYFGGHTYRQVAVILEHPEGTVKTRIRTGLRRLHTLLSAADVADAQNTKEPS